MPRIYKVQLTVCWLQIGEIKEVFILVTLFQKYIVLIFPFLSTFLVPLRALHNFGNLYEYMSVIDLMNCKLNLFRGNNI